MGFECVDNNLLGLINELHAFFVKYYSAFISAGKAFRSGDGADIKLFHQIIQYGRREEGRKGGAQVNVLNATMQQV